MMRVPLPLVSLAGALVLAAACGGTDETTEAARSRTIAALDAEGVPAELLGFPVTREDVTTELEGVDRPYLEGVALYSVREEDTLQATLQVGRFADDVELDDDFRTTFLNAIPGSTVKEFRVGEQEVWISVGEGRQVAIWFLDRDVFVLSTRADFPSSRSLLREALEIRP